MPYSWAWSSMGLGYRQLDLHAGEDSFCGCLELADLAVLRRVNRRETR